MFGVPLLFVLCRSVFSLLTLCCFSAVSLPLSRTIRGNHPVPATSLDAQSHVPDSRQLLAAAAPSGVERELGEKGTAIHLGFGRHHRETGIEVRRLAHQAFERASRRGVAATGIGQALKVAGAALVGQRGKGARGTAGVCEDSGRQRRVSCRHGRRLRALWCR